MDELHTKIMENYYDIIVITEVYAKNKDQDDIFISERKIPGYNLYFYIFLQQKSLLVEGVLFTQKII